MKTTEYIALGRAIIDPDQPVVAGSFTTVTFTYTAGHPVDDSGYVKIAWRSVSDFGRPQFDDPAAPNYCTVHTTGGCRIEPRWDPKGHTRPWSRALFLMVRSGYATLSPIVSATDLMSSPWTGFSRIATDRDCLKNYGKGVTLVTQQPLVRYQLHQFA